MIMSRFISRIAVMLVAAVAVTSVSCEKAGNYAKRALDNYERDVVNPDNDNYAPDAEKKPQEFYRQLLEQFCRKYYHDCFNRDYFDDSLIVDNMYVYEENREGDCVVSYDMVVVGRHSYEGNIRHNDDSFKAYVFDKGGNTYEVHFEVNKHYLIGDDEAITATRTITFYD